MLNEATSKQRRCEVKQNQVLEPTLVLAFWLCQVLVPVLKKIRTAPSPPFRHASSYAETFHASGGAFGTFSANQVQLVLSASSFVEGKVIPVALCDAHCMYVYARFIHLRGLGRVDLPTLNCWQ